MSVKVDVDVDVVLRMLGSTPRHDVKTAIPMFHFFAWSLAPNLCGQCGSGGTPGSGACRLLEVLKYLPAASFGVTLLN